MGFLRVAVLLVFDAGQSGAELLARDDDVVQFRHWAGPISLIRWFSGSVCHRYRAAARDTGDLLNVVDQLFRRLLMRARRGGDGIKGTRQAIDLDQPSQGWTTDTTYRLPARE